VTYADGVLPPTAAVLPARPVVVVNLSAVGMLIETAWHIRPSRLVEVRLQFTAATLTVCADVLRAYVSTLDRHRGIRYRAALAFTTKILVPRDADLLDACRQMLSRR
jgi:hypothetical protein